MGENIDMSFNIPDNLLDQIQQNIENLIRDFDVPEENKKEVIKQINYIYTRTKYLSITDDLTGLSNRRYFDNCFEKEFLRAANELTVDSFANHLNLYINMTYSFELVTPLNPLVVYYDKPAIYFLLARQCYSGEEVGYLGSIGEECMSAIQRPKVFPLTTLADCVKAAAELNLDEVKIEHEGFVVKDAKGNRVKIKNPNYVIRHRMSNGITNTAILDLYRLNELDDFLAYYPKYYEQVKEVVTDYEEYRIYLQMEAAKAAELWKECKSDRKLFATTPFVPKLWLAFIKYNFESEDFLNALSAKQILKNIKEMQ
jgi:hypothetical protein